MILGRRAALTGGGATLAVGLLRGLIPPAFADTLAEPLVRLDSASQLVQGGWAKGLVTAATSLELDGKPAALAPDGRFFIAFDRDAAPAAVLRAVGRGGASRDVPLAIAPGHWEIEQVDAPFHPPAMPDETFAALRKGELARIAAARSHDTGAQGWRQDFIWPVKGRISGKFGAQRVFRGTPGSYHAGLDIATGESGTPYVAPADGVVVLAATPATGGPFTLEGNLLMVDHGMGLSSAFLHNSQLLVSEGDKVAQGQPIGRIGMTGRATGPHLHWGLRWHEARLDPLLFVPPLG